MRFKIARVGPTKNGIGVVIGNINANLWVSKWPPSRKYPKNVSRITSQHGVKKLHIFGRDFNWTCGRC
jgi:hypothetical protein